MFKARDMNLDFYNENGYIVIKKAFYPTYLDQLRNKYIDIYQSLLKAKEEGDSTLFTLFQENKEAFINAGLVTQNMIETYELMNAPQIVINVRQLLEKPVVITKPVTHTSHSKLGGDYWQQPPHRDSLASNCSNNSIVVWIPLSPLDKSTGTLRILRGSHRLGDLPYHFEGDFGVIDNIDESQLESLEIEQGDTLIFDQRLVHASDYNNSDKIRWAISFRYGDAADPSWAGLHYPYNYVKR